MEISRKDFMRASALAAGAAGMLAQAGCAVMSGVPERKGTSVMGLRTSPLERVRVGVVGVGRRGAAAAARLAALPDVEVRALSDLYEARVSAAAQALAAQGRTAPELFFGSGDRWRAVCELPEVDLVYVCTPWLLHTPMSVYAMRCGKHVAVEVPAAVTLEQCWQLVDTAEVTRRHCVMLENTCYGEDALLALSLCRGGVLGELVHGEASCMEDLRKDKLRTEAEGGHQGQWRLEWSKQHTGNPFPTHGLGPVCQCMGINRGDRLECVASVSSDPVGLSRAAEGSARTNPRGPLAYRMGDMNTSVFRTVRGRTIVVRHTAATPRPRSRAMLVSGTRGFFADDPLRVALEPKAHGWLAEAALAELKATYAHPLWGQAAGGGMDVLMDMRLCHCLLHGLPMDSDVYDAAAWSALVELSERSVVKEGAAVDVPDFTRGGWKLAPPLGVVGKI